MESTLDWLFFLLCAFGAEIVGTMAGFGAATILTPVALVFMDAKAAVTIVACFHLFGNGSRLFFFGRRINWAIWAQFGIAAVIMTVVGATVTSGLPSAAIKFAFGIFLVVFVTLSIIGGDRVRLKATQGTLIGGGVSSGFIAGLIGTGGAIRSACLLTFGLAKEAYIGTSASIAFAVDATRIPIYLSEGFLPPRFIPVVISLILVAFAGTWVGRHLVSRVSAELFRRLVLVMLGLMSLKLLWDGWHALS